MSEAIRLFCGVSETRWNTLRPDPGPYACVSPVYGRRDYRETSVWIPPCTTVLLDSGAFSDGPQRRLDFEAALSRQIAHAEKWGYKEQVEWSVAYDLLIDERWMGGVRYKSRWAISEAWEAVDITVRACEYYAKNRHRLPGSGGLVLPVQGVDAVQQCYCAERVISFLDPDKDILGLGGWCILGKRPKLLPEFWRTMWALIPGAARRGVKRVHIFGVMLAKALGGLLWICDEYGIKLSTDSSGPSCRPAFGIWGYADWCKTCNFPPGPERGQARIRHVQMVREWLRKFRSTIYYKKPPWIAQQLTLW